MSYRYWNNFVGTWQSLPASVLISPAPAAIYHSIHGWENPNLLPLMNSQSTGDFTLQYIPEPWWGNSGKSPLHCVFMNHNPFSGGPVQLQSSISSLMASHLALINYQSLVSNEVSNYNAGGRTGFYHTCNWHRNQRSRQILTAINKIETLAINPDDISSMLSIELIPWHTKNFGGQELNYLLNNQTNVLFNCFQFAAEESRRICNITLRNKPLIRTTRTRIENILSSLVNHGVIPSYTLSPVHFVATHRYSWDFFTINHPSFIDIKFCRIQYLRNALPGFTGTEDFLGRI